MWDKNTSNEVIRDTKTIVNNFHRCGNMPQMRLKILQMKLHKSTKTIVRDFHRCGVMPKMRLKITNKCCN